MFFTTFMIFPSLSLWIKKNSFLVLIFLWSRYIDEADLVKFLRKQEVASVLPQFEGAAETGKVEKSALRNWVVSYIHFQSIRMVHMFLYFKFSSAEKFLSQRNF